MINLSELNKWRQWYDNTGVYCTAYRYKVRALGGGGKDQPVWGHLYIDLDSKDDFEQTRQDALKCYVVFDALFGLKPEEIRCYFSGKKGIHLIVPAQVLGIQPHPDLNMIFRSVAEDLQKMTPHKTVDTAIYDRKRLFRLPGSVHQGTGLYKIPLTYDELKSLTYEQVRDMAGAPRKDPWEAPRYNSRANRMWGDYLKTWDSRKAALEAARKAKKQKATLDYTPPCVRHIIMYGCREGKRNITSAALANHYKQRGLSEHDALERMQRWNENKVNPPLTDTEIETTVRSIYRGDYSYGCSTLEQIGPCDPHNCRMGHKRR